MSWIRDDDGGDCDGSDDDNDDDDARDIAAFSTASSLCLVDISDSPPCTTVKRRRRGPISGTSMLINYSARNEIAQTRCADAAKKKQNKIASVVRC